MSYYIHKEVPPNGNNLDNSYENDYTVPLIFAGITLGSFLLLLVVIVSPTLPDELGYILLVIFTFSFAGIGISNLAINNPTGEGCNPG